MFNIKQKEVGIALLILDNADVTTRKTIRYQGDPYIFIKRSIV